MKEGTLQGRGERDTVSSGVRGRAHTLLSETWSLLSLMPEDAGHVEGSWQKGKGKNVQELSELCNPIPPADTGGWSW